MEFSIRRVRALFKKETKEFVKNWNVLIMCVLPLAFSLIYSNMMGSENGEGMSKIVVLELCLGMSLAMVSSFVIAMLIAEEKEKNTLRTLMLSAVSPWEFMAGKALITIATSLVINIALFFLGGIEMKYFGAYLLLSTLVLFSMVEIGAVIGMLAPNQMSTGVVGLPVIMVLFLLPMLAQVNKSLDTAARLLPNHNMNLMLERIMHGSSIGKESIAGIVTILAWIVIGAVAFAVTYKKKGIDK